MKSHKDYKQSENTGWKNMEILLDQNMPQKKKRRFIWYLPLLGLSAIVFLSFLIWTAFHKNTNNKIQLPTIALKQVANEIVDDKIGCNERHSKNNIVNHKINQHLNKRKTSSITEAFSISQRIVSFPIAKNKILEQTPEIIQNTTITPESSAEPSTISTNDLNSILVGNLPILKSELVQHAFSENSSNHLINTISSRKTIHDIFPKWQFGIHSGGQYYSSINRFGYIAGLDINFKIRNRWSLSLSPALEIIKGNFLVLDNSEKSFIIANLDSLQNTTNLFTESNTLLADALNKSVGSPIIKYTKLFNLRIPLTVDYKVTQYWSASLGMNLYIPLQNEILNSKKSNILQWDDPIISTWNVEPLNWFLQAGIKYFPIRAIGISFDYSAAFLKFNNLDQTNSNPASAPVYQASSSVNQGNLNHFSVSLNYKF